MRTDVGLISCPYDLRLDNSPEKLIHEIILVDDASTFEHLGQELEDEVAAIPKTRLIRLQNRSGLIRAKVAGATNATGEVRLPVPPLPPMQ